MLKCVFALVLLYLCGGLMQKTSLNDEIIGSLKKLERFHKDKKLNLTSNTVRFPSSLMNKNAASCVGVFARELNSLLLNVTVHEDAKDTVEELRSNLRVLKQHPENDDKCPMQASENSLTPFWPYRYFIRKVNLKKK